LAGARPASSIGVVRKQDRHATEETLSREDDEDLTRVKSSTTEDCKMVRPQCSHGLSIQMGLAQS
jgi:hypothetical protein